MATIWHEGKWLSQFGLYRYEQAQPYTDFNKKRSKKHWITIFGMFCFCTFFVFIFFYQKPEAHYADALILQIDTNDTIDTIEQSAEVYSVPANHRIEGHFGTKTSEHKLEDLTSEKSVEVDKVLTASEELKVRPRRTKLLENSDKSVEMVQKLVKALEIKNITNISDHKDVVKNVTSEPLIGLKTQEFLKNFNKTRNSTVIPQHLVFLPSKVLKPPKLGSRTQKFSETSARTPKKLPLHLTKQQIQANKKRTNRRQFNDYFDTPRPFNYPMNGQPPAPFQTLSRPSSTAMSFLQNQMQSQMQLKHAKRMKAHKLNQVNSIQDIISNSGSDIFPQPGSKIQFSGVYRHPRKNNGELAGLSNYMTDLSETRNPTVTPTTQIQPYYPQYYAAQNFLPDPFHNFKPKNPSDINQLATNQYKNPPAFGPTPTSFTYYRSGRLVSSNPTLAYNMASIPAKSMADKNMYQQVIQASNRHKQQQLEKIENQRLSLMLDIYPMKDKKNNQFRGSNINYKPFIPSAPIPSPNGFNPHQFYGNDNSYFNTMNFPQIQQQKYPLSSNFYNNMYFKNMDPYNKYQAEESMKDQTKSFGKPSQLVVHLNLYPKNMKKSKGRGFQDYDIYKRASVEGEEFVDDKESHTKRLIDSYGRHVSNYTTNVILPTSTMQVTSDESASRDQKPFSINFKLNGKEKDDILDAIEIPKNQFNVTMTSEFATPGTKNYVYDEAENSIVVGPSLMYNNVYQEYPIHLSLTNSTTDHKDLGKKFREEGVKVVKFNADDAV